MEVACWHTGGGGGGGGGDVQQPKNPGPKPIKCLFCHIRNYNKLLHVYVLPYFTHCMEVACWHTGGGGGGGGMFSSPKTQGLSQ